MSFCKGQHVLLPQDQTFEIAIVLATETAGGGCTRIKTTEGILRDVPTEDLQAVKWYRAHYRVSSGDRWVHGYADGNTIAEAKAEATKENRFCTGIHVLCD